MKDILALAESFHVLADAPGIRPWSPIALDNWANHPIRGDASRYAAQFVLSVWDYTMNWKCGRFDMTKALRKWDAANMTAWKRWAANPWWA